MVTFVICVDCLDGRDQMMRLTPSQRSGRFACFCERMHTQKLTLNLIITLMKRMIFEACILGVNISVFGCVFANGNGRIPSLDLQYILENIVDRFVFPSQIWFVAVRGEDRSQHGVLRHCIAGVAPGRCAKQCPECEKL